MGKITGSRNGTLYGQHFRILPKILEELLSRSSDHLCKVLMIGFYMIMEALLGGGNVGSDVRKNVCLFFIILWGGVTWRHQTSKVLHCCAGGNVSADISVPPNSEISIVGVDGVKCSKFQIGLLSPTLHFQQTASKLLKA